LYFPSMEFTQPQLNTGQPKARIKFLDNFARTHRPSIF
jgi:hypothetical protein